MRRMALGVLMAALVGVSAAQAESVTIVAPVYGQIVGLALPEGFSSAYQNVAGGRYIHEFLPEGETLQQWSQMVTVTGAEGGGAGDPVKAAVRFAETVAQGYVGYCPGKMVAHQYRVDGGVRGAAANIAIYLGCPAGSDGGPGEAMVMVVAVAGADLYTLQWAKRFDAAESPELLNPQSWITELGWLIGGSMLCARVEGEKPPYPSCTG
jgi:hypothetical protein